MLIAQHQDSFSTTCVVSSQDIVGVSSPKYPHMEGQETSDSNPHQGKLQNYLAFCTHPDVRGFEGQIHVYTRE